MTTPLTRDPAGRKALEIRPLTIETNVNRYAEGSVLIRAGHTHVLCTATVEEAVPGWLKGKGKGWVTAEYSMLPRSTHTRTKRDREKLPGRTHEIQRLIGRALRSVVDMSALGERQVLIDCDVLQADGGTRTASITGSYVALAMALAKTPALANLRVLRDSVAAISVGMHKGSVLVDLDYNEDSGCDVDMNFVMTGNGRFVEVQGTAEQDPFSESDLNGMTEAAKQALAQIREIQLATLKKLSN